MEHHLGFDFSFEVAGQVWQLRSDPRSGLIALEVRDQEEQSISFLVFDLQSLEVSDYLGIPGADWWSTIHSLQGEVITLIRYEDQQDLTSKSLIFYNWHQKEVIDVKTEDHEVAEEPILPVFAGKGSEIFELCQTYLGRDIELGVEYYEWGENIIFSYYLSSGAKFDRHLMVIKEGEEFCNIRQDKDVSGMAVGSFMIQNGYLVFISDSNQVNGIEI